MLLNFRLPARVRATRAVLAFLGGAAWACSGGGTEPGGGQVEAVSVAPGTASVPVGSTLRLSASALSAGRTELPGRSVVWASADSSVAAVSADGVVSARKLGSVQIQVAIDGRSAYAFVNVVPRPVAAVAVSPASASVAAGATTQLQTAVSDDRGAAVLEQPVLWRSSNDAVARVTSSGLVSGVAPGVATITATAGDNRSGSANVTVTGVMAGGTTGSGPGAAVVARITVQPSPNAPAIAVDDTMRLTASAFDSAGALVTGRATSWVSSNAAVATVVSATGVVRAIGVGEAVVTATIDGKTASTIIAVVRRATRSVDIGAPPELTVGQGPVQLTATPRDAGGQRLDGRTVLWASSNDGVVTVGRTTGVAEARGAGSAVITASVEGEGISNTTTIIVKAPSAAVGGLAADFLFGCTNLVCAFTDASSGAPIVWGWEFGDGVTSPFRNSDNVFKNPGTYAVKLTVTNDQGARASVTRQVTTGVATAVRLVNRGTGRCLSVEGLADQDPRALAFNTRPCGPTPGQLYALPSGTGAGPIQLAQYPDRYLEETVDLRGDVPDTRVWQWNGSQHQRWTRTPTGELRNHSTGRCLTDVGDGRRVTTEGCGAQPSQRWDVRP